MSRINFNNKTFKLLANSNNGKVDSETIFKYRQEGDLVTADYQGGAIIYGKIIAQLQQDKLQMLYNCYTTDKELKSGKAIAHISITSTGKIKLVLNWEWIENHKTGTSTYIEI